MPTKGTQTPVQTTLSEIELGVRKLFELIPGLSQGAARTASQSLALLAAEIDKVRSTLDPIKDPGPAFDPSNPETAGRLVALALLAQDRVPLARIAKSYGSGVYAIYYLGSHPVYQKVSGTETPLYVGKADPESGDARTSREQGPRLYGRLCDHRKMIRIVGEYAVANKDPHPLKVEDFDCRRLVCATNAQLVAERHLIEVFKPIWNSEIDIAYGISKHGDSAKTRSNARSPWDVIHPGRKWALDTMLKDQTPKATILEEIKAHFKKHPPSKSREPLILELLSGFIQQAPLTSPEVARIEEQAEPQIED